MKLIFLLLLSLLFGAEVNVEVIIISNKIQM